MSVPASSGQFAATRNGLAGRHNSFKLLGVVPEPGRHQPNAVECLERPLAQANSKYAKRRFAGVVLVSNNESWVSAGRAFGYGRQGATGVVQEWQKFVANQQRLGKDGPKLVCIDLQAYATTQAPEREDILNIAGFRDAAFNVVASFLSGDASRFVAEVEAIEL